jgi:DNA topoisomerase-3
MTSAAMKSALASLRPAEEFERLEQAARSRSEADWIVGMNATRAATIRLRSSFDGAVSLGRVQTPTLAIVARREEEIKAFVPEPYWLVDATFVGDPLNGETSGERVYIGHFQAPAGSPGKTKVPGSRPRMRLGRSSARAKAGWGRSRSWRRKSSARKRRCSTT